MNLNGWTETDSHWKVEMWTKKLENMISIHWNYPFILISEKKTAHNAAVSKKSKLKLSIFCVHLPHFDLWKELLTEIMTLFEFPIGICDQRNQINHEMWKMLNKCVSHLCHIWFLYLYLCGKYRCTGNTV